MSIQMTKLIPVEVGFIPLNVKECDVKSAIDDIGISYSDLEIKTFDTITFVDCGINLEYVRCPFCHKEAIKWWASVMTQGEKTGFRNRGIVTPCCERFLMLEEMDYCLSMGFSKYIIEIIEPSGLLTSSDVYQIGNSLGCPMKKISARY